MVEFTHHPQPRSFALPNEMTVMKDGLRWPNRGIISWLSLNGSNVDIDATKHSCTLMFLTSEQLMAFRFKFDTTIIKNTMWLKHFALSESEWLSTAAERAWLSDSRRISPVHYVLRYNATRDHWLIGGPELSLHHVGRWTMNSMDNLSVFRKHFIGGQRNYVRDVTTAMEIINEMRLIWVNAPVMLHRPNEKSFDVVDITDQDPLFVALMRCQSRK